MSDMEKQAGEARDAAGWMDGRCGNKGAWWLCTRPEGHSGEHVCWDDDGREIASWPQSAAVPAVPSEVPITKDWEAAREMFPQEETLNAAEYRQRAIEVQAYNFMLHRQLRAALAAKAAPGGDEREAFEAYWSTQKTTLLQSDHTNRAVEEAIQEKIERTAWQARAALSTPAQPDLLKEMATALRFRVVMCNQCDEESCKRCFADSALLARYFNTSLASQPGNRDGGEVSPAGREESR